MIPPVFQLALQQLNFPCLLSSPPSSQIDLSGLSANSLLKSLLFSRIMFDTSRHCYWGPSHHRYPVCSIGVYSLSIEVGYGEAGLTWRKCCSNFSCAPGTTTQSTTVRKCADAPCVINKGWLLLCQALLPAACINVQYLFHVQYILVANKLENILLIKLRWNKVLVNQQHGGTKCLLKG